MSEPSASVDIYISGDYVTCEVRLTDPAKYERCGECGSDHEVAQEQRVSYEMTPWSNPNIPGVDAERVARAIRDARAALDRFAAQLVKEADSE